MVMFLTIIVSAFVVPLTSNILAEDCDLLCSSVFDPVCGMVFANNGVSLVKYQNLCTLWLTRCLSSRENVIKHVPNQLCGLKTHNRGLLNGRRNDEGDEGDFSIVGAHQACNHTCPTYCVDTYEPVCGNLQQNYVYFEDKKWKTRKKNVKQTFINHCHVDLLSCTTGINVTIIPVHSCYKNMPMMFFMSQVAGAKSLGVLDV